MILFKRNLISIDSVTGAKSGSLYNAVLYRRRRQRRTEQQSILEVSLIEVSEAQKQNVLNFLKTCVLPANIDSLKTTLSQYKDLRMSMIRNSFDEYKEVWLFYFTCPDLVRDLIRFFFLFSNIPVFIIYNPLRSFLILKSCSELNLQIS